MDVYNKFERFGIINGLKILMMNYLLNIGLVRVTEFDYNFLSNLVNC